MGLPQDKAHPQSWEPSLPIWKVALPAPRPEVSRGVGQDSSGSKGVSTYLAGLGRVCGKGVGGGGGDWKHLELEGSQVRESDCIPLS